jgi:hypothetical protein
MRDAQETSKSMKGKGTSHIIMAYVEPSAGLSFHVGTRNSKSEYSGREYTRMRDHTQGGDSEVPKPESKRGNRVA